MIRESHLGTHRAVVVLALGMAAITLGCATRAVDAGGLDRPSLPPLRSPAMHAGTESPAVDDDAFLAAMARSVVLLEVMDEDGDVFATGTAFFVGKGMVATARHVIEGGAEARIRFATGAPFPVTGVLWDDGELDAALLSLETPGLDPVALMLQEHMPRSGTRLVAVGRPAFFGDPVCAASYGRALPPAPGEKGDEEILRLRIPLVPGWSGGPVLSPTGEVVGVSVGEREGLHCLALPARHLAAAIAGLGNRISKPIRGVAPTGQDSPDGGTWKFDDADVPTQLRTVTAACARGDVEGAIEIARGLLVKAPEDPEIWSFLGVLLDDQGRETEAISAMRKACELKPESSVMYNLLASTLLQRGRTGEAAETFREVASQFGKEPEGHYGLGYALMSMGRFEEAARAFRCALAIDPAYAPARQGIDYVVAISAKAR